MVSSFNVCFYNKMVRDIEDGKGMSSNDERSRPQVINITMAHILP